MSQSAYTCIEQLDLAAHQLNERNPSYARFALILTDNVVELIIHRVCSHELSYDDMWVKLGKPRFTPEQRSDALGQRLDKKVKLCKTLGKISSDQSDAIQICHKYRNELYHAGLRYNDIIWDIAWFYHDIAIALLETVFPDHSWYSGATVTSAVEKHAGKGGKKVLSEMHEVAASLRQTKPTRHSTLPATLSKSAVKRTDETVESLEFLVADDPQNRPEAETIEDLQFYDYIRSEEPLVKEIWGKVKNQKQRVAAVNFIREVWKPKHASNPLPTYHEQAKKIAKKRKELDALKEFERFKSEFAYFSGLVEEAAIALDHHIQHQIDVARGK
jgi:hypothetical protein